MENIQKHFKKMKADFKIVEGNRGTYGVDVKNGVFIVTKSPVQDFDINVLDVDVKDRHILLNITTKDDKGKSIKDKWLFGHDERDWFVGAVPGQSVKNIWEGKQSLKPNEVVQAESIVPHSKKHRRRNKARVRQGEWFFIPQPDFEAKDLAIFKNEQISRGRGSKPHIVEEVYREGGTLVYVNSHFPNGLTQIQYDAHMKSPNPTTNFQQRTRDAAVYGRGYVKHKDHETIYLDGWHKIIMNTESGSRARSNLVFLD